MKFALKAIGDFSLVRKNVSVKKIRDIKSEGKKAFPFLDRPPPNAKKLKMLVQRKKLESRSTKVRRHVMATSRGDAHSAVEAVETSIGQIL